MLSASLFPLFLFILFYILFFFFFFEEANNILGSAEKRGHSAHASILCHISEVNPAPRPESLRPD